MIETDGYHHWFADPTGLQLELWLIKAHAPKRFFGSMVPRFWMPIPLGRRFNMHFMIKKTLPTELTHKGIIAATNQLAGTELWLQDTLKISTPDFEALFVTWSHIFLYHLYPLVNVYITNWKDPPFFHR